MRMLKGFLLAALLCSTGCFNGSKKPNTVRPVRPDEPRNTEVPTSISRLLPPDEINEDNCEKQLLVIQNEIERDQRAMRRAERRSASADK